MSEKEARAEAFAMMKRTNAKPKPKSKPRGRRYRTAGSDRRDGIIGRKCSLAEAIYKANG